MIRKTVASIPLLLSLASATTANAQLSFAVPDPVAMMAVGVTIEKADCRSRFPEFAVDIDRAWEVMIERNVNSIPREVWKAFDEVNMPLRKQQTREDCAQMAAKLDAADFGPTVAAVRKEFDCMARLRAATERTTGSRPIIGIGLSEKSIEARVSEVDANGPAAVAGFLVGDVVTEWDGSATPTKCQLAVAVLGSDAGKQVFAVVNRLGASLNLRVVPRSE